MADQNKTYVRVSGDQMEAFLYLVDPGEGISDSRKEIDALGEFVKTYRAKGLAWIIVEQDGVRSPIAKFFEKDEIDKIKSIALKNGLSIQEEKVLSLLLQDLSNQEIADELFVSVNTIRNHIASIYKKTGMKKKELREKYYYGK